MFPHVNPLNRLAVLLLPAGTAASLSLLTSRPAQDSHAHRRAERWAKIIEASMIEGQALPRCRGAREDAWRSHRSFPPR
jgi:hypothetical protein